MSPVCFVTLKLKIRNFLTLISLPPVFNFPKLNASNNFCVELRHPVYLDQFIICEKEFIFLKDRACLKCLTLSKPHQISQIIDPFYVTMEETRSYLTIWKTSLSVKLNIQKLNFPVFKQILLLDTYWANLTILMKADQLATKNIPEIGRICETVKHMLVKNGFAPMKEVTKEQEEVSKRCLKMKRMKAWWRLSKDWVPGITVNEGQLDFEQDRPLDRP